jgi:hypothetical protein
VFETSFETQKVMVKIKSTNNLPKIVCVTKPYKSSSIIIVFKAYFPTFCTYIFGKLESCFLVFVEWFENSQKYKKDPQNRQFSNLAGNTH